VNTIHQNIKRLNLRKREVLKMGFGDLLKKATDTAVAVKNQFEKHQAEMEAAVYLPDDTETHGYIDGNILPKDTNKKKFSIDINNRKIIVFDDFAPKQFCVTTKKRWLYEIPLNDVVSFKIKSSEITEHENHDYADYIWELGLASGDMLTISNNIRTYKDDGYLKYNLEQEAVYEVQYIILTFIKIINDNITKAWVNEFYSTDIFKENGELSPESHDTMLNWYKAKLDNWKERLENYYATSGDNCG